MILLTKGRCFTKAALVFGAIVCSSRPVKVKGPAVIVKFVVMAAPRGRFALPASDLSANRNRRVLARTLPLFALGLRNAA
jgi:hypothetical protein